MRSLFVRRGLRIRVVFCYVQASFVGSVRSKVFFSLNKTSNASTLVGGQLVKCYREGSGKINRDQHGFGGAVVLESWPRSLGRRETEGRRASSVFARDGQEGF